MKKILFLLAMIVVASATAQQTSDRSVVNVSGEGIVKVEPDEVLIKSRIEHEGPSATSVKQKNDEGLLYKNQYYFMASINKQTVATCLIVDSDSVYGIYGVATAPQFRKQGIATSLMKAAITSCLSKKEQLLTLQTVKDSNAEKLYQTLGFKEDFNSQILKKEI